MATQDVFINSDHIGEYIDMGSEALHYIQAGEGESVLLVHGEAQSLYTWHEVFYPLSAYFNVLAVDLFGHGYSSAPEIEYTIRQHSETLREFLNAKGVSRTHIVAFSMGAIYALDFAQQNPDMVDKLVLISPGGVTPQMPFYVRMYESALLSVFTGMFFSEKKVRELLMENFFDQTNVTDEIVAQYYQPLMTKERRSVISATLQAFDEEDVLSALRATENDTLIFWGADDKWHPTEMLTVFQMALKNCEIATIRNCGHLLHEEKPDRFLELVLPFLGVQSARSANEGY